MTEPSSARDHNREHSAGISWEQDAELNLGGLLNIADTWELPPITWTIDRAAKALVGKAVTRYEWDRWLAAVNRFAHKELYVERRPASGGDMTHLTVRWDRFPHPVDVVITAALDC